MPDIQAFVDSYGPEGWLNVAFDWHPTDSGFSDRNAQFRREVIAHVLREPGRASVALLRDLYTAETEHAKATFGTIHELRLLAELMVVRGGALVLETFGVGMHQCFDAFMASRAAQIPRDLARDLAAECERRMNDPAYTEDHGMYKSLLDGFNGWAGADGR